MLCLLLPGSGLLVLLSCCTTASGKTSRCPMTRMTPNQCRSGRQPQNRIRLSPNGGSQQGFHLRPFRRPEPTLERELTEGRESSARLSRLAGWLLACPLGGRFCISVTRLGCIPADISHATGSTYPHLSLPPVCLADKARPRHVVDALGPERERRPGFCVRGACTRTPRPRMPPRLFPCHTRAARQETQRTVTNRATQELLAEDRVRGRQASAHRVR
jgi:hypothetical protein